MTDSVKNRQRVPGFMHRAVFLFLLLVVAPVAQAQTTAETIWGDREGHWQEWRVLEDNQETANAVKTGNFTWFKFSTFEKAIPESVLLIEVTMTVTIEEDGVGVWNYTLEMANGGGSVDLTDCFWHVRTFDPGVLGGNLVTRSTFIIQCAAAVNVPEDTVIDYWINRTVLSGSPNPPSQTHVSITGDRADFIVTSNPTAIEQLTGANGVELLVFLTAIVVAILFWSRSKDEIVQVFSGLVLMLFGVVAISIYQEWVAWIPFGAILFILGAYFIIRSSLEALTNRG